jgi:hypothetical protein
MFGLAGCNTYLCGAFNSLGPLGGPNREEPVFYLR